MRLLLMLLYALHVSANLCDLTLENSNFTISQGDYDPQSDGRYLYNYDRLRLTSQCQNGSWFLYATGDGIHYWGNAFVNSADFALQQTLKADTPFNTQTPFYDYASAGAQARVYRLYGGYDDGDNRISAGLQNITMGVGRIWTPTNLFNPKNSYAIEPDEVYGVAALSYTRTLGDTTQLHLVASQKRDYGIKSAARVKLLLESVEVALDLIDSDSTKMAGYEIEGALGNVGLRSEGAYIDTTLNTSKEVRFFQGIAGADYGFVNGLTLTAEMLYSSERFDIYEQLANYNHDISANLLGSYCYGAMMASYPLSLVFEGALLYIESFSDTPSRFIAPTLTYRFSDYSALALGALLGFGPDESEFGMMQEQYYLKFDVAF